MEGPVVLSKPDDDGLREVVRVLREWQQDRAPMQLHPGDVGWHWQFGAEGTAAAVWTWSRDGQILAVGLLDSPKLLRLAAAPEAWRDEQLAQAVVSDAADPERGVLPPGAAGVEARFPGPVRTLLLERRWVAGEPWTPLERDLAGPVEDSGVRIEVIGPGRAHVRVAVQRAAFPGSSFTEERWRAMAAGPAYADARCIVVHDPYGAAVAMATVWSAGPGRPGLLEPVGVHREHRGRGYGTAITFAAAAALREMGSSSATVCTRSSNVGAVATYRSAGFRPQPEVPDLRRHEQESPAA